MAVSLIHNYPHLSSSAVLSHSKSELHSQSKSSLLAKKTLEAQGNGDFVLNKTRTAVYMSGDLIGGIRQGGALVQAATALAHTSAAVSHAAGILTPIGLLLTGPQVMGAAAIWTIPDAYQALEDAKIERTEAKGAFAIKEADHALTIARLGVAHQWAFFAMGAAQAGTGAVIMSTSEAAKVFHYAPLLTGHAAHVALTTANVALGAVYFIRGSIMLVRSRKSFKQVKKFRKEFEELKGESLKGQMAKMKMIENRGSTYFERRVDPSCLEYEVKGKVVGTYSAYGVRYANGMIRPYISKEEKEDYIQRVDKGIYTQELKHKVALIIATAMILGGATAVLLATVVTGGVPMLVIALASAIFFMSMEYLFLTYDSTTLFNKLRDSLYARQIANN